MKFTQKEGLTEKQLDAYWAALEKSQGEDMVDSLREMRAMYTLEGSVGLLVYGKDTKKVKPGAGSTIHCLLNDRLESKNVAFPELYVPYIADIEYQDGKETVLIHYNFQNQTYSLR